MRVANIWETEKFERKQREFVDGILLKLPKRWAQKAKAKYAELAKESIKKANEYLLDLSDAIEGAIEIDSSNDDLISLSIDCVNRVRVLMSEATTRHGKTAVFNVHEQLEALCIEYSVRYPVEHDRQQILARLSDSAWWVRGLRVALNKKAEAAAIDSGLVHKRGDVYCSTDMLERRTAQHKRNADMLNSVQMINMQSGEIMSLGEIAQTGTGNQENRRSELITRVRGFEELAAKYGHSAEFVTITCPSRMHAVLANGKPNEKYDGTKPDEAQQYLVENWARVRAQFARDGVKVYGLRIAEPHHDATPHWHLILFMRKDLSKKYLMRAAFKKHYIYGADFEALNDEDKQARLKNGVLFVSINQARGSASGYVLKYVLKNIGGIDGETSDEAQQSSTSLYPRVEAWASCWRIRQFQQIGGHYVSVWRELRRVDECKLEGKRPNFVKAWQACQKVGEIKADFAQFIECMGGLDTPPNQGLYKVDKDYQMGEGKYGKTVIVQVLGVGERFGREVVATNRQEWVKL